MYKQPKTAFDLSGFETVQVFFPSKDGTRIPMFLTYKKGIKLDGSNPVYLYGYGGFDISLSPSFSSMRVPYLEAGGIYAQVNLRGGGEYGEAWHLAGTKMNKQNVFDDFIGAAEWLIANGYTSSAGWRYGYAPLPQVHNWLELGPGLRHVRGFGGNVPLPPWLFPAP